MTPSRKTAPRGIALPMTIIAIAALVLLVIGLITVLTLERKTARSYSDAARADLAVESGLAVALGSLTEIAKVDTSVVFRLEDPTTPRVDSDERPLGYREQFFNYGAVYEGGNWRGLPLFSGGIEQSLGVGKIEAELLNPSLQTYVDSSDTEELIEVTEHDQNIPRAQWVEVPPDPADEKDYTMRYAYWVEDLSGRVDGRHVTSEPRDLGITTAEMDTSTIIDPSKASGAFPDIMDEKRETLRTSASLRLYLDEDEAKRIEPYIHYYDKDLTYIPQAVIPQGFDYEDAGQPAPDLNEFVAAANVEGIADHIGTNLPDFDDRKGGFPAGENYLQSLAASIIDYADEDSDATIGPGYRGVDSYPFVNEMFDRYEWTGGGTNDVKVTVETYVELWNPSDKELLGTVFFINQNRHQIRVPPGSAQKFSDSGTYIARFVKTPSGSFDHPAIPPNGFAVLYLGKKEYSFPASSTFPPSELIFTTTTDSNYSLRWNGKIVDYARGGLQRTDGNLKFGNSNRKWKGNSSPALDYSIGQSGDPRSSYYINTWVFANNYDANTSWGGRCIKRSISNSNYNEVRLNDWADSGSNSTGGTKANSDATRPTSLAYPANQPDMAPAVISNAGRYNSLAELGNIFDPAQLSNVNATFPVGNSNAGGGFSLAIGRPEFGAFDRDGKRSAQLLDIFSIQPEISDTSLLGRPVNINTAPREVLRALVAGVTLGADPATPTASSPVNSQAGDIFADFVLAQRAVYPLRGPSDFNNIRKNPAKQRDPLVPTDTPFFGSMDAYPAGSAPPATWDDAGREELFRKTLNLVTFSSKTYRIVVAGEAIDSNGKLIARKTREYHYSLEPLRDSSTGEILTNASGDPTLEITKLYEKSY
ncbi:MAG: hypothetical protein ABJQ29_11295 [Luteolibacter sp.]